MRVLVVGAGPTGLTAAVELARQGIVPVVIDRKDEASTLSRAVGILPSSLRALEPSGVTKRLVGEGILASAAHVFRGRRRRLTLPLIAPRPGADFGLLALAQDRTEDALRDGLRELGGDVQYGTRLEALRTEGDRVLAVTNHGETAYDFVIGADGVRSAVRESAGIAYPGFDLHGDWSIADVDTKGWPYGESLVISLATQGRVSLVVPIGVDRCRVVSNTADALETLAVPMDVVRTRREGRFQIAIRQAETYRKGRIFLAGDAAHCHSPVGGRGMNLGISDAAELARCLVTGDLDTYGPARHAAGAAVIAQSERGRKLVTSPRLMTRGVLWTTLGIVRMSKGLQRRVARGLLSG